MIALILAALVAFAPAAASGGALPLLGAGGAGRVLWTPGQLGTSLERWYKADAITAVADGGSVATWPDSAGNVNLTQATSARQPIYETAEINGLPVVRFATASQRWMSGAATGMPTGSGGRAVFMVVRPISTTVRSFAFSYGSASVNAGYDVEVNTYNGGAALDGRLGLHTYDNGRRTTAANDFAANVSALAESTYASGGQTQAITLWMNGASKTTEQIPGTAGLATDVLNTGAGSTLYVGTRASQDVFANFDMGEIVFVDRDVTSAEREKIEGYLAWRWGLQGLLPGAHPYKSAPPYL